jgi:hypothetical protein
MKVIKELLYDAIDAAKPMFDEKYDFKKKTQKNIRVVYHSTFVSSLLLLISK